MIDIIESSYPDFDFNYRRRRIYAICDRQIRAVTFEFRKRQNSCT